MSAPDLFGILDVIKKLTAPAGMEAVHEDGFSWARNGRVYGDSTKLTSDDWNRIIGNLRGLLIGSGVDLSTLDPASPMLLRDVLQNYLGAAVIDILSGIDVGGYGMMPKAVYDADNDGRVDSMHGGTGAAVVGPLELLLTRGFRPSLATAKSQPVAPQIQTLVLEYYAPNYLAPATLVGGGRWARMSLLDITARNLPSLAYFRHDTDRYLPDGTISALNGGYWALNESVIDLRMLGAGLGNANADTAALIAAVQIVDGKDIGSIRLPPTNITINQTIDIALGLFDVEGFGRDVSTVTSALVNGAPLFRLTGHTLRLGFRDLKALGNQLTGALGNGHAFALWDTDGYASGSALPKASSWSGYVSTASEGPVLRVVPSIVPARCLPVASTTRAASAAPFETSKSYAVAPASTWDTPRIA